MHESLIVEVTVLVLAAFVGVVVVSRVPAMLHTPLMSATNAIHGIVVVGAILVAGATDGPARLLALVAVGFGAVNVVGGFLVTDRMLRMFRRPRERGPDGPR